MYINTSVSVKPSHDQDINYFLRFSNNNEKVKLSIYFDNEKHTKTDPSSYFFYNKNGIKGKVFDAQRANAHEKLLKAVGMGDEKKVQELIKYCDVGHDDSRALILACMYGRGKIVDILLPLSNPKAENNRALVSAASYNHIKIVEKLLPFCDPKENDSMALYVACARGNLEIVKLLLPLSDAAARNGRAFLIACENEHIQIARLLLKQMDNESGSVINDAMKISILWDNCQMIDVLFEKCNKDKIKKMASKMQIGRGVLYFMSKYEKHINKEILSKKHKSRYFNDLHVKNRAA